MAKQSKLTQERVKEVLDYDPATGIFVWKIRPAKNIAPGTVAGRSNGRGSKYRYITVDKEEHTLQRVAWFYVYGEWPRLIRFQDGDVQNCAIENLRNGFRLTTKFDCRTKEGRSAYQKAHRAARPDYHRASMLMRDFKMTIDEYATKLLAQGGKCAICGNEEREKRGDRVKALAVDHDHETGTVRDLLCGACNKMIGHCRENPEILMRAAKYVERHKVGEN